MNLYPMRAYGKNNFDSTKAYLYQYLGKLSSLLYIKLLKILKSYYALNEHYVIQHPLHESTHLANYKMIKKSCGFKAHKGFKGHILFCK